MKHLTLQGGIKGAVPGSQVMTVVTFLMLSTAVLAALMWTNVIEFASNDAKLITASILTFVSVILVIYTLYIGFDN